jgi:tetratricopeptide (TPR) repeat protein
MHEFGLGELESALRLTQAVLDAGVRVENEGQAIAGILRSQALEMLDRDIDEVALSRWIEDAVTAKDPRRAASGTSILARCALKRDEQQRARALLERAVELWNEGESMTGGPEQLRRLALLDIAQGSPDEARRHLELALEWLKRFPDGGMAARFAEKKIRELLQSVPAAS